MTLLSPEDETVTYHDPCYLGRHNKVYMPPRELITSVPGVNLVEMDRNREKSFCCGAGGGRMFMEETIGKRINIARTEQALETRAGVIASSCPFCMTMMTDGVKSKEMLDKVKVMDIAELVDPHFNIVAKIAKSSLVSFKKVTP